MNELNSSLTFASASTSSNITADFSYMSYFHPKFPKFITVILIIIGDIGNILSFIIFCSKSMRNNSVFTYLACLSIVDFFVVTLGLGDLILTSYFGISLKSQSIVLCRVHTFLTYFFTHLSSFILASVSIDRAIALNSITLSRVYCKPVTAYKVLGINLLLVFIINFHSLIFLGTYENMESDENGGITNLNGSSGVKTVLICGTREGTLYKNFLEPYFEYIDLFSYAIIPFLIMLICTILIIKVVVTSTQKFKKKKDKKSNETKSPDALGTSERLIKSPKNEMMKSKAKRSKNVTLTLIILNVLFFCLVSPLVFFLAFSNNSQEFSNNSREMDFKIIMNTVTLLAYSNHCFNFIFYGLSCPAFRTAIINYLGIKKSTLPIANPVQQGARS